MSIAPFDSNKEKIIKAEQQRIMDAMQSLLNELVHVMPMGETIVYKLVSKPKKKVLTYSLKHVHSIWNLHATYTNAKMEETSSALLL